MNFITKKASLTKSIVNLFVTKKEPISLVHFITNRCNARCGFCFINFADKSIFENELTTEEIEKLTKNLGSSILNVNFTGGEPFARKDIIEIARSYCKNTTIQSIYITTNGSLPERVVKFAETISNEYNDINITISISIDDIEERHNEIRKIKGLFKECLKTYFSLKKINRVEPVIQITVSEDNYARTQELYHKLTREYGVDSIKTVLVRDEGVYKIPIDKKEKILESYLNLVNLIKTDSKNSKINMYDSDSIQGKLHFAKDKMTYDYIERNYINPKYETFCPAGRLFGIIGAQGQVYACEILENDIIGMLRENNYNFMKIWNNNKNNLLRKKIKDTNCNCTYDCALSFNFLSSPKYQPRFLISLFK